MNKILRLLDGWKTILAYIFAQIFGNYPLLLSAFNEFIADPKDAQKILNFLIQLGLALGLSHRLLKNLKLPSN